MLRCEPNWSALVSALAVRHDESTHALAEATGIDEVLIRSIEERDVTDPPFSAAVQLIEFGKVALGADECQRLMEIA